VPHCTLAEGLDEAEAAKACGILYGYEPIAATVSAAGIKEHDFRRDHHNSKPLTGVELAAPSLKCSPPHLGQVRDSRIVSFNWSSSA
jgi:hypothetical protein